MCRREREREREYREGGERRGCRERERSEPHREGVCVKKISWCLSSPENARSTMKQRVEAMRAKWRQRSWSQHNRRWWHAFIYGGECGQILFRGRLNLEGFEFKRWECLDAKHTAGRIASEEGKVTRNGVDDDE